jgi:hypothetical protein
MTTSSSVRHEVARLVIGTGQRYEAFRAAYEDAVPPVDPGRLARFAQRRAGVG